MQDIHKRRGRKPKDGEKLEKPESVRYMCPYSSCDLEYQSSLGYKRHLMYYKHSIFCPSEKRIVCGHAGCEEKDNLKDHFHKAHPEETPELLEAHEIMVKIIEETEEMQAPQAEDDIVHDEGLLDISRVLEENGVVQDILMTVFPKGITYIIDLDRYSENNQTFYCRIPGCGRQFKSLMAYKYHCGKFTHVFKSLVDEYSLVHGPMDYQKIKSIFKKRFNLENRFLLEGVSHHLMKMPDQHYNFIFTFDESPSTNEKRRTKKRSREEIGEFSLTDDKMDNCSEEEGKEIDKEEEEERVVIDSIVLNRRRLPKVEHITQGRLSFLTIPHEIVFISTIGEYVLVGAKEEKLPDTKENDLSKGQNIFSFSRGNALLYIVTKEKIISRVLIEGFGYPRKAFASSSNSCFVLFNDGSLHELLFTQKYTLHSLKRMYNKTPIVDFSIFNKEVIICTHSGSLINLNTKKERHFPVSIISIGVTSESVLIVDVNGRVTCLSPSFEDLCHIPSKIGTNVATGLGGTHDLVFISNSLYGLGRIYSISSNRTLLASPQAGSNVMLIKPGFIVSSGLDGTIYVSGYESEPKVYMKVIRTEMKGNDLLIRTSDEEHALTENITPSPHQEPKTTIQGIVAQNTMLSAAFACGVIIFVSEFFKYPPKLPFSYK
ncbi:hypothetical protein NEFER03_0175 [Nematocida sp. LUAm3]|nr:hypothetical protein NEFER03_0175 [Nematocida sp. LUAm3]KAI5173628.1 hypothetical protein NEFER02_0144 [Nematocida sp. LUAm2]KAI5176849.1 hypothetical protein NEFER01_0174 [Nematocida sp. LUAm1]